MQYEKENKTSLKSNPKNAIIIKSGLPKDGADMFRYFFSL